MSRRIGFSWIRAYVITRLQHEWQCTRCWLSELTFFFFQAEDGIRDLTVTGVQTCALPISRIYARRVGVRFFSCQALVAVATSTYIFPSGSMRKGCIGWSPPRGSPETMVSEIGRASCRERV